MWTKADWPWGRTPPSAGGFIRQLFFCCHFSSLLLKLWCFSEWKSVMKWCQRKRSVFHPPPPPEKLLQCNDKCCSTTAERQISVEVPSCKAGGWMDFIFLPWAGLSGVTGCQEKPGSKWSLQEGEIWVSQEDSAFCVMLRHYALCKSMTRPPKLCVEWKHSTFHS